ncbi:MAG: hypothetical protein AAFR81_00740 [Chloroflexota bacterium]
MIRRWLFILVGCFLLTACEAPATPIAVITTPTATPAPTNTPLPTLRYGLAPNIAPYVGDLSVIADIATVEQVNTLDNIAGFDIVIAYGDDRLIQGWQATSPHTISLAINTQLVPLDDAVLRDLVARSLDIPTVLENVSISGARVAVEHPLDTTITTRTSLANLGVPDGVTLSLATSLVPATDTVIAQYAERNIRIQQLSLMGNGNERTEAHLYLFRWIDPAEREQYISQFGADNVLDLWIMPVSYYLADENLPITFTDDGFPIPITP